jgi:large subunit ribosomal protein L4
MAVIKTYQDGKVADGDLDDATFTFGERMRPAVLREAVVMYEANRRVGTVNTLSRRFVNGSGKKFQRQKHVGRARHGDRKAPQFRGGGVAHGPHPRDFSYSLPRKALRRALQVALAGKLKDGEVARWQGASFDEPSTKAARGVLAELGAEGSALIVSDGAVERNLLLSVRNLPRVKALPAAEVSAYDVVAHRNLVLLDGALEALVARIATTEEGSTS